MSVGVLGCVFDYFFDLLWLFCVGCFVLFYIVFCLFVKVGLGLYGVVLVMNDVLNIGKLMIVIF